MDLLGLAFVLPFAIAALMAHLGFDFTDPNIDLQNDGDK